MTLRPNQMGENEQMAELLHILKVLDIPGQYSMMINVTNASITLLDESQHRYSPLQTYVLFRNIADRFTHFVNCNFRHLNYK